MSGLTIAKQLLVLASVFVLAGCGAQPTASQQSTTPSPVSTKVPVSTTATAVPVAEPVGTTETAATDANYATKVAENPSLFAPDAPTRVPTRDVDWLVDLLRSSPAITITAYDIPGYQLPVGKMEQQHLADAARSGTVAAHMDDDWLSQYVPFPGYELKLESRMPAETIIVGGSKTHFSVTWYTETDNNGPQVARYLQNSGAFWDAIADLAPAKPYTDSTVRYLLNANALRVVADQFDYTMTGESFHIILAARVLASGTLTKDPVPTNDPNFVVYFTVNGKVYEVKLWDDYFTYDGNTYYLKDVGRKSSMLGLNAN